MKDKTKYSWRRTVSVIFCALILASVMPQQAYLTVVSASEVSTEDQQPEAMDVVNEDGSLTPLAENQCGENISWSYSGGLLTLNGSGEMYNYTMQTAPWYQYASEITSIDIAPGVTSIGNYAFYGCAINSVTIPSTVTVVGTGVFDSCTQLQTVTIPEGVTEIKNDAFYGCTALTNLRLPSTLNTIGNRAFYNTALTAVTYAGNVTAFSQIAIGNENTVLTNVNITYQEGDSGTIGKITWAYDAETKTLILNGTGSVSTFWSSYRSSIENVIVGEGITKFQNSAFRDCYNLTSVSLPDTLVEISVFMFRGCSRLEEITIPESVTKIDSSAFFGCTRLSEITIPASVLNIGSSAFQNCTQLEKVTVLGNVFELDYNAFSGCSSLKDFEIVGSIARVGGYTFSNCTSLVEIEFPEGLDSFTGLDQFTGCTALQTVILPASFQSIYELAYGNFGEDSLNILYKSNPEHWAGITNVGKISRYDVNFAIDGIYSGECETNITWTFDSAAKKLTIEPTDPSLPASIGAYSYYIDIPWTIYRGSIRMIEIKEGVTAIGNLAFYDMDYLQSVFLPKSVTDVDSNIFNECENRPAIYFAGTYEDWQNKNFSFDFSGYEVVCESDESSDDEEEGNTVWAFDEQTGKLTISGSGKMQDYTMQTAPWYQYASEITSIDIAPGVTSIGNYAFYGCAINSVTIPSTVTVIGTGAFDSCNRLQTVTIPEGVTEIKNDTFYGCAALTNLRLPSTLTIIGNRAFYNTALANVTYAGNGTDFSQISIGNNNTALTNASITYQSGESGTIGQITWTYDSATKTLTLSGTGHVGEPAGGYEWNSYRSSIETVVVEEGITGIASNAFKNCYNLTSVSLASTMTGMMYSDMFSGCTNLEEITIPEGVTELSSRIFYGCSSLKSITIPASVQKIYNSAFENCTSLEKVTILGDVSEIGGRAFSGCSSLKEFEIVGNISVVDYYAFENCTSLVEIEFPEGLTQLTGDGHFCGCTALQRVIFPSSLELIDDPFWGGGYIIFPQIIYNADPKHWAGITNVQQMSQYDVDFVINGTDSGECGTNITWTFDSAAKKLTVEPTDPSQSASVNGYTLDNSAAPWSLYRGSIQTLEIKEGVTAIREQAFTGMNNLNSILLPESITEIARNAFPKFQTIYYAGTYEDWQSKNFSLNFSGYDVVCNTTVIPDTSETSGSCGDYLTWNFESETGTLTISSSQPDAIDSYTLGKAPWYQFASQITTIQMDSGVTVIGDYAFADCINLTTVNLPEKLFAIDQGAFSNCIRLNSISIPDEVESIGAQTFYNCKQLRTVDIPVSVTMWGTGCFDKCTGLWDVYYAGSKVQWHECGGAQYIPEDVMHYGSNIEAISGQCGENASWTFDEGTGKLTISGTGPMYNYAQSGPGGLGVSPWYQMGDYILSVEVQDGITYIGSSCFWNCYNLQQVTISSSVTNIGAYAFCYSDRLENIHYMGGWSDLTFAQIDTALLDLLTFEDHSFGENLSYTYQDGVLTISGSGDMPAMDDYWYMDNGLWVSYTPWRAYRNSIEKIIIEEGVTSVSAGSLCGCPNLTVIELSSTVQSMDRNAMPDYQGEQIIYHGSRVDSPDFLREYKVTYTENSLGSYSNNINWTFDEMTKTVTISGYSRMDSESKGPWTQYPFNEAVEYVVIEEGITSIDEQAFRDCVNLQSVSFPDSLLEIGRYAFYGCDLRNIVIGDNVIVGQSAFQNNSQLADVLLGENVSFQDYYRPGFTNGGLAFADCPLLKTAGPADGDYDIRITFGNTRSIAAYTFYGCTSLTSVTIPDNVIVIGFDAFGECKGLKTIELPEGLLSINQRAFSGSGLTDVIIPEKTLTIQENAFSGCTDLQSVTLPSELTKLYDGVFSGCTALSGISIPESVTYIGSNTFSGCKSLNNILLPDGLTELGWQAFAECTSLTNISIPDGVEYLEETFAGCSALSSVKLPSGMKRLNGVFSGCISLTNLTIPNSVTELNGLDGCSSLKTLVLPNKLETIWPGTFRGCKQLNSVTIPKTVTYIGQSAFEDCYNLSEIYYEGTEEEWKNIQVEAYGNAMLISCTNLHYNTEIPGDTSGDYGDDLIWGFDQASGKLIISGSGSMESIDKAPWSDLAAKIQSVEIGSGITNIASGSFSGCSQLRSVTLPETVTAIEENAFIGCINLHTINFAGSQEQWNQISIADGNDILDSANVQYGRRGDIDFSGITDARDAILLTRYLSGWDNVMVQDNTADVNGDGKVDALDAVYLTRLVAGWDGYDLEK